MNRLSAFFFSMEFFTSFSSKVKKNVYCNFELPLHFVFRCCNVMMIVCMLISFVGPVLMSCPDVLSVMFVNRAAGMQVKFQTCYDNKV
jgi:nucleosome binding factor SPN SPT16 subunit